MIIAKGHSELLPCIRTPYIAITVYPTITILRFYMGRFQRFIRGYRKYILSCPRRPSVTWGTLQRLSASAHHCRMLASPTTEAKTCKTAFV